MIEAETVVVGAGSSGAVIAARMSENPARDVLLIEAGPDYPDVEALPSDLVDGTRNSMRLHDWGFRHLPTRGQVLFDFPRGKVVGGSSAVNTCIALRGTPEDYDEWASRGLGEWSFIKCLPAFKALESDQDFDNEWHGRSGPIPIRRHTPDELTPWQAAFLEGARALGFAASADHNDPRQTGVGPHAMNKLNGVRMSAARCYLTPEVRRRENLRIRANSLVRRVVFEGRRAIGLEIETDGAVEIVRARTIVLSAGALQSPAILLRSGIGPRAQIEQLGVELVADVPAVGARLLDHPGAVIVLVPRWGVSRVEFPLIQTMLRFTSEDAPQPNDMQLQPGSFMFLPALSTPCVTLMCCVGKPRGTGTLTVTTVDPRAKPRIESRLLEDDADRARAVEALELAWLCARTPPMHKLASFLWPNERTLSDRRKLDRWIFSATGSGYHPCGTVPMGADDDSEAALDAHGRVRGVDNLLVADASIMPTIPSANTNLTALMIGERFGEWLRDGAL